MPPSEHAVVHRGSRSSPRPSSTGEWLRGFYCLTAYASVVSLAATGCQSTSRRVPLDPIPMHAAAGIVNDNAGKIVGVLRATGSVDGHVTFEDGRRQSYHLDAVLFFLSPSFVRFDLKAFGQRQLLFGSNIEHYWYYDKQADVFHCGRHGVGKPTLSVGGPMTAQLPARPEQIIEVLGLRTIGLDATSKPAMPAIHRVEDEHQQILVVARDESGSTFIEKEYWLDRYAPRLMRRMLFRDQVGVVTMESRFDDYKRLVSDGPWLPHRITATWPPVGASMSFRIAKWTVVPDLGSSSIQFRRPGNCLPR